MNVLEGELVKLDMKVSTFCAKSTSLVDLNQQESSFRGLSDSLDVAKSFGVKHLIPL